jgi:hypothetical protein
MLLIGLSVFPDVEQEARRKKEIIGHISFAISHLSFGKLSRADLRR